MCFKKRGVTASDCRRPAALVKVVAEGETADHLRRVERHDEMILLAAHHAERAAGDDDLQERGRVAVLVLLAHPVERRRQVGTALRIHVALGPKVEQHDAHGVDGLHPTGAP